MSNFVGVDIAGAKEIEEKLKQIPPEAQDAGVESAKVYIVNFEQAYPPYTYVSIEQAGGWRSEKQRRYVMARIREGSIQIPYARTQTLRKGWRVEGSGRNQIVVNEVEYAPYVKDIQSQAQGHMLRGWGVVQTEIQDRMDEIVRKFDAGVKEALRKLGLT